MERESNSRPTAEMVLAKLLEGNQRFVSGQLLHPNHCEESRKLAVSGQTPIATILTCSDSRVPPVDIFDQGIGDLFIVRVAGNIIGDHTLGSIEFAVSVLQTPLVVVMGHSSCGAVSAVMGGKKLGGHIATLAPPIQSAAKLVKDKKGDPVNNTSRELAKLIARRIAQSEPIIADHVTDGTVKVLAMYYDLGSGKVDVLEDTSNN